MLTSKRCTIFAWNLQYDIDKANGLFIFFLLDLFKNSGIGIAAMLFLRGISKKNANWEIQAMVSLDLRNLIVPFCLLKASNAFRLLKKDDVLEILCSDTENLMNLMKIFPSDSYELISAKNLEGPASGLKVLLKKINP